VCVDAKNVDDELLDHLCAIGGLGCATRLPDGDTGAYRYRQKHRAECRERHAMPAEQLCGAIGHAVRPRQHHLAAKMALNIAGKGVGCRVTLMGGAP
jgi:hypothetical protein